MRKLWGLLAFCAVLGGIAVGPADARLGERVDAFKHSALNNEKYFEFEGVVGARYRFSGGKRCKFGDGLLALDTINGTVVQQVLVMPYPETYRMERQLHEVAGMFLREAGLDEESRKVAIETLVKTYQTAKPGDQKVGKEKQFEVRTYCKPALRGIMLVVAMKP